MVDGLAECDFGDWDGRSVQELQYDEGFCRWIAGEQSSIPDGEDADAFQQRVMQAFEQVVQDVMKSGASDTVICTHGGVIMLIMVAYALPRSDVSAWQCESGCGFTLRVTPSIWMRDPVAEAIDYVPIIPEQ